VRHSTPGRKLNPLIARLTAPIYARNPERYNNLCRWVWHMQRQGWPDEAIAECLRMCDSRIDQAGNWFGYLTSQMPKAKGRAFEDESRQTKKELGAIASEFVEFLKHRQERSQR
jgi:hypothetical protein